MKSHHIILLFPTGQRPGKSTALTCPHCFLTGMGSWWSTAKGWLHLDWPEIAEFHQLWDGFIIIYKDSLLCWSFKMISHLALRFLNFRKDNRQTVHLEDSETLAVSFLRVPQGVLLPPEWMWATMAGVGRAGPHFCSFQSHLHWKNGSGCLQRWDSKAKDLS